jgi:hypothetical protein
MYTTNTKSIADNTSVSAVWKFSTQSQTINSAVDCTRHVPQGAGTSSVDYKCSFASEASLGDNSTQNCLSYVKSSIITFPYFR